MSRFNLRPRLPVIVSLGAGVQSTALCLMIEQGLIYPVPLAAIFADTQAEPSAVYKHLEWLEGTIKSFPIIRTSYGNLSKDSLRVRRSLKSGNLYHLELIPAFREGGGMLQRRCTGHYKIEVVQREIKKLLGLKVARKDSGLLAYVWLGITTDEAQRMKPSSASYIKNCYPLIEANMSRQDCLDWMKNNGYPRPPRSACIFCPYHSDEEWLALKTQAPTDFKAAVVYERKFRQAQAKSDLAKGQDVFLHDSLVPLDKVTFSTLNPKERMGNECEGMCGV